jgi:predicted amidohydrolase
MRSLHSSLWAGGSLAFLVAHSTEKASARRALKRLYRAFMKDKSLAASRFAAVTSAHVLRGLQRVASDGVQPQRGSHKFCLVHDDHHYPPKLVLAYAYEEASGETLDSEDHAGGPQTNDVLEALGFSVVACTCRGNEAMRSSSGGRELARASRSATVKVAFLAFCDGSEAKRIRSIEKALAQASSDGAKLLVVPEASLQADGPFGAESDTDARLAHAVNAAAVGLIVGRVEDVGGPYYRLRADLLDESGRHAFSYFKHADPSYSASSGFQSAFDFVKSRKAEFPVANVGGLRIGILICHDIVYPALAEQYSGRIDLLVTISGVSNNTQKWLTFICERSRELNVPVTHICCHAKGNAVPGSVAVVAPGSKIHRNTNDGDGPKTFADKDLYLVADLAGPYVDLLAFLSVKDRGERPKGGRTVRIDGKQGVVQVSRSIIESGSGFQRVVSRHINEPVLYLVTNADGVLETTIRARAIENVVPIAIPESDGYRIFNPTRYRQVSSYFDRGVAVVDEQRQAAGSVFKRIPETAYRKLLA